MIIVSPILRLVAKILSLILFAITLFSAFGGRFDPNYFTLPAIAALFMQWLGIATFIVTVLWFIGKGWITGILGVLTLVASWSSLSQAVPLNHSKSVPEGAQTFTILTFNSLHLTDIKNPGKLDDNRAVRYLINSGADIICLQELINWDDRVEIPNMPRRLLDSLFTVYPYRAGTKSSDLKVLSKYPVESIPFATNGRDVPAYMKRFARFKLKVGTRKLELINMHLTSYSLTDKERQVVTGMKSVKGAREGLSEFKSTIYQKMKDSFKWRSDNVDDIIALTRGATIPVIVCGDFNDVAGSWSYRKLREAGFNDAYAETCFGPAVTYNQHLFLFHIDQIFYRGPIEALSVKKLDLNTSDHYPLMAEFAFLPQEE